MIILSNCLTDTPDEGCLKVANSLIKRIKAAAPETLVISYERSSTLADCFLKLNKLLLSRELLLLLREKEETVLYIPFPARPIAAALRCYVLSMICPRKLWILPVMNVTMGFPEKMLYRLCKASFLVLSETTYETYREMVGPNRVVRIRTGVDTAKFIPISSERQRQLKEIYGFDPDKKLILHVGHLSAGRNICQLLKISRDHQVLLVTSTETKNEQDQALRKKLEQSGNIRILDSYLPRIQEIYQMADAYFFPVLEEGHCIDVPLSCLEAAACGKPVVTTYYGEMRAFIGKSGFYFAEDFEPENLNQLLMKAVDGETPEVRTAILEYDWDRSISALQQII